MTDAVVDTAPSDRAAALVTGLAAAVHARAVGPLGLLGRSRPWRDLPTDTEAMLLLAPADSGEYRGFAVAACAFAVWHRSADRPEHGSGSAGRALRRLGEGPGDPGSRRAVDRILTCRTLDAAAPHLLRSLERLRATAGAAPPDWKRLAIDLAGWDGPGGGQTRHGWARDYTMTAPRKGTAT